MLFKLFYFSVYPSTCLAACPPDYLSIIYLCLFLSFCVCHLPNYIHIIYLSVCLYVCISVCLSVYLTKHPINISIKLSTLT